VAPAGSARRDQTLVSWKPPGKGSRESGVGKREAEDANGQPAEIVSTLRFGHFGFQLPVDENAEGEPEAYELPAVLSYPECPSLLLEAEGEGREAATQVIQNVMLRLLTTFPPGKVRFTIIDPVGLGQNFSAFMHLADYDEKLVSSRIWTEGAHIHQRLADLTAQIATVGASIKQVVHDRAFASSDVSAVNVVCTVETRDRAHLDQLLAHLQENGVEISSAP
jgi:hypothetical protein